LTANTAGSSAGSAAVVAQEVRAQLSRQIEGLSAAHPERSGFAIIRYGRPAFTARVALAYLAETSLDVQYCIWEADATGRLLAERLVRAAERGVKVRVPLDDINLAGRDARIAALDALVGGRNVGAHYFEAHDKSSFRDLDIVAIGTMRAQIAEDRCPFPLDADVEELCGKLLGVIGAMAWARGQIAWDDPAAINTEAGLYVQSPKIARQVIEYMDEGTSPENSYHVLMDDNGKLRWIFNVAEERLGYSKDPKSTWMQRFLVAPIRMLPLEKQL
jgi:putative cardiolipin synthase